MTRIPYIDDAIIPQAYGLKGTINLLRIVYHSPKVGEAFAHIVAAEFTGLYCTLHGTESQNTHGRPIRKLRGL